MPKGSKELTASRKEEIITACEELYKAMSFKEITIKEIGNATSFTRTSIYNYFQTKEEIFLALLQREYERWPGHTIKDIKKLCKGAETVCDMEIQFDSTGGDKLVTDEKKINAWIDKVKSYIG
ncbi:TetR/AcrR family transcriptional regulator [Anaerotignum sp. MSJ-24]|uniref:TetR/AcrR family transcriptional regulator n=1 Tax=Anaerotignum sp. MSJ-24 TaxID=2841521 RepID=UPI00209F83EB|nr:TetR/AcrR family transcriptional regulator [Anaerotignum sp. MSJ-24]